MCMVWGAVVVLINLHKSCRSACEVSEVLLFGKRPA